MVAKLRSIYCFYRDGFCRMTLGKTLWKIIIIKLVVLFAVLKFFFFPDYLQTNFANDRLRADHVIDQLTHSRTDQTQTKGGK